jgi:CheY-like chemotaxis protein
MTSNPNVPPEIVEALSGKNVAVVGVDPSLAAELKGIFQNVGATVTIALGVEGMGAADLVVSSPAASVYVDPAVPLLVIGPLDVLVERRGASEHFDFVVAPPIRPDEVLLRAFRVRTVTRRHPESGLPVVLAVDDDATTTAIVRAVVTRSGMTCHVAANGRQALEAARTLNPSVIVLDVNMPFLDGFEVLSTLRNDPQTATIPVVMLTSVQQESDIVRGFGLGADDYVVKPFNPMELVARVKRLVRKS